MKPRGVNDRKCAEEALRAFISVRRRAQPRYASSQWETSPVANLSEKDLHPRAQDLLGKGEKLKFQGRRDLYEDNLQKLRIGFDAFNWLMSEPAMQRLGFIKHAPKKQVAWVPQVFFSIPLIVNQVRRYANSQNGARILISEAVGSTPRRLDARPRLRSPTLENRECVWGTPLLKAGCCLSVPASGKRTQNCPLHRTR
jgi:hypothetical protein